MDPAPRQLSEGRGRMPARTPHRRGNTRARSGGAQRPPESEPLTVLAGLVPGLVSRPVEMGQRVTTRGARRGSAQFARVQWTPVNDRELPEASERDTPRLQPFEESGPAHAQGGGNPRRLPAIGFADRDELVDGWRRRFRDRDGTTASRFPLELSAHRVSGDAFA